MNCKYDFIPASEMVFSLIVMAGVVLLSTAICVDMGEKSIAFFVIGAVCILLGCIQFNSKNCGEISADDIAVSISYKIFGIKVYSRKLEYDLIDYASAEVNAVGTPFRGVGYVMLLSVVLKKGGSIQLKKVLSISSDMPANDPDKYKEYIAQQPLSEICSFINEKIRNGKCWNA